MNWRLLTWKDIAGSLLVLAIVGGLLGMLWTKPNWRFNFGFDPSEWKCTVHASGDPTCVKKRPAPPKSPE
jgi:hypothetical protein